MTREPTLETVEAIARAIRLAEHARCCGRAARDDIDSLPLASIYIETARAVLATPEIERLVIDAYKRGFEWCVENMGDPEAPAYLNKAACDYADGTLSHFKAQEEVKADG